MCGEIFKTTPTNLVKKSPLDALSSPKQKAQRETTIETILRVKFKRQGLGEDKEYVAHKITSTYIQ